MDYGFAHHGTVYTPNRTTGIAEAENADRNRAIEAAELEYWQTRPDRMVGYYDDRQGTVSTWLGTRIGTITSARVYRHNFGGRFIAIRMVGTNGAEYYGRASYDWGTIIRVRKVR